nr:alpha/beta hydrolase [Paracoccus sp. S-4012]
MAGRHWAGDKARPALALHCSMGSSSYWGPIAARLGGIVDLHAFDAPGHGRSGPHEPDGTDYHTQLTGLAAARLPSGGKADLIGHSLGATVALRLAVENPARVRTLTLIEPVMFAALPDAGSVFTRVDALLAEGRDEDATREFLGNWGDKPFDALPAAARQRMTAQMRIVAEVNDSLVHDRARMLAAGRLEAVTAPVMLIRGADSPGSIARIEEALAARLPDARQAVVAGAAHMVPITHPDDVAALIAENLARA